MKKWILLIVVAGVLLCFGQLGKTQELKNKIAKLKIEQTELVGTVERSSPLETQEEAEQSVAHVAKVMAMMRDLEKFRGGGKPEAWAALGLAMYDVPPAQIPDLAQHVFSRDFSPRKAWIIQALIEHWSQHDFEAAFEAANRLEGQNQILALRGLIAPLLANDPKWLEEFVLKRPKVQELSFPFLEFLVQQDPLKAAQFVVEKMGNEDDFSISKVAEFWTQQDPNAALEWAISLPEKSRYFTQSQRNEGLYSVFSTWSDFDRNAALETVLDLEPGTPRRIGLSTVLGRWARDDGDAALDYIFEELPAEDRNNRRFLERIAGNLEEVDADKVIAVAKRIEHPEHRGAFLEKAASGKLNYDDRALEIADLLPEGSRKDKVYEKAARDWTFHDLAEATTWLESLPEKSSSRDAATVVVVGSLAFRSPMEAERLAESISDRGRRKKALTSLAGSWLRNDRAAATKWIQARKEFSAEERANLLR